MQAVPAPGLGRLRPVGRLTAALAAVAALAATASLVVPAPSPDRPAAPRVAVAGLPAGMPLQRARCADWWHMTGEQRQALIGVLRGVVGGASTTGGRGTTLTDAETTRLFDNNCANPVSDGFLLYLLYARAAGFRSAASATGL